MLVKGLYTIKILKGEDKGYAVTMSAPLDERTFILDEESSVLELVSIMLNNPLRGFTYEEKEKK